MVFFGEDEEGNLAGFKTGERWKLLEDDGIREFFDPELTFEEFIREKILACLS